MNICLKSLHLENFKGIKSKDISFTEKMTIKGANATGKTSIVDAILWLLFDKNSEYSTKFGVRPVDENGATIHFIDIVVKAVFDIDGVEHELSKTQKENWVKTRGTEESVFKGNVNTFEIDGYPRLESEYKAFVSGLIDEEMFKILTSPTYFPSMDWKKQREIIMTLTFANEEKDYDLARRIGGFDELLDELSKAPSTDDILAKYKKAKKELESKLKELPVRIDEVSKSKVDYDLAELELAKRELESKLTNSVNTELLNQYKSELLDTEFALNNLVTKANADCANARREYESKYHEVRAEINKSMLNIDTLECEIRQINNRDVILKSDIDKFGKQYFAKKDEVFPVDKWVFDENSTVCSMCGQKLPAYTITKLKSDFAERKANAEKTFNAEKESELKRLVEIGNTTKAEREKLASRKTEITAEVEKLHAEVEKLNIQLATLSGTLNSANLDENVEYKKLAETKATLMAKIDEIGSLADKAKFEKSSISCELEIVKEKIAKAYNNNVIDERIEELKEEQRDVSQRIADCDKMLYLTESFIKAKLDAITNTINSKFDGVTFLLFANQINGGISECCTCCVNGVEYKDLNNGHRIVAGLNIIKTLSEHYEKIPFVFIDNAESVNDFNIPDINGQIIQLVVTEDKNLTVESV